MESRACALVMKQPHLFPYVRASLADNDPKDEVCDNEKLTDDLHQKPDTLREAFNSKEEEDCHKVVCMDC